MKLLQIIPFLFSVTSTTLAQSFCSATGHSGQSINVNGNKLGKIGNVNYQLWADSGNNRATFYSDGSFSCGFERAGDYLCRTGLSFEGARTPSQIGRIKADFKVKKESVSNVGYSYIGIYGWTKNPRVEWYIVDDWLSKERPGDWIGNQKKGDFTIDGAEYTVYRNQRADLTQYFSLRKVGRDCGTIDISAHFDQWEKLGMTMGTLDEAKVLAEIGNGNGGVTGTVDFPYAKVYLGNASESSSPSTSTSTTTTPAQSVGQDQTQGQTQGQTQPPAQNAPTQNQPPTQAPPTQNAPTQNQPPSQTPPTQAPPAQNAPTQNQPPTQAPPTQNVPVQAPPTQAPPPQNNNGAGNPWGNGGGNPFGNAGGNPWGNAGGNPFGNGGGNPFGNGGGNPFGNGGGNPFGNGGGNPFGNGGGNPSNNAAPAVNSSTNNKSDGKSDGNCAATWAQCGGEGFKGPNCCISGNCKIINKYYHQCKP
ncbi:concanavalin A-like lectin/glucanase [Neocallimastix californiae]|uniref:endo-1,4-beta-xylanase n=1 Tax=Neocallimastix californiae TaxID=1754190 RepID=A0A1Y2DRZ8_9FUNG|nr:concanavalin A-like lectin/glucanase [Neocallimastix californiae]|eukprot:ORY62048.1 concanavalin A-like lectin/glucanase [Neocallimastix californiae]